MAEYFPIDVNYKSYSGSFSGSFFGNGSGLTGINAGAGGSYSTIQFNDSDRLSGSGNFTFNQSNNTVTLIGNLIATSFTGSLLGTASYATQALSASWAPGGGGSTFPYTGSAIITGSLIVTGSTTSIDGFTGSLFGTASWANNVISASYAANGGVTQLLAGPNITLSPTDGKGQVTVSATLSGSTIFNTATGSYGSFYDTTTQTNPVGNVPRSMSFDSTDITNGVSISGSTNPFNTYIKTTNAGVYNIQFSAQIDKTDSGADEIVIWLRKNGIDLTDTATTLTLSGNNDKKVAAWNWFVTSAANDYYQIIWISTDTDLRLLAEPISGTHPGIPSVILTANRVDQFLSNTGSFNGSFTGSLFGTASWATNALTASFINTASTNAFVQGGNSFGATALLGTNDNQSLAFETSGSTRIFISSSENVGIGTTTPTSASLVVNRSSSLMVAQLSSNNVQRFNFRNDGVFFWGANAIPGSAYGYLSWDTNKAILSSGVSTYNLALATGGNDRIFISASGNVGIGTATPDSYYAKKLVVSAVDEDGITIAGTTTSATNYLAFADGTTGNQAYRGYVAYKHLTDQLAFGTGGTLRATIDNSGNFGIGTSTSTILARMHVRGTGATSATTALRVENSNASASFVVRDNGSVGIGTATPSVPLEVVGNMIVSGGQTIHNSSGTTYYNSSGYGGGRIYGTYNYLNGEIYILPSGSNNNNFFFSPNNGMSIGGLTIGGTTGSPPAYGLAVSGSIGVGTRTPITQLDVSGSGRFTSNLTVTGSLIAPSITGSLQGTASWANNAISASWAPSVASNPFPFTGSAIISGSLTITGSLSVTGSVISNTDGLNRLARYGSAISGSTIGTGVTAQTIVFSQLILANTFAAGDIVRTYYRFRKLSTNANATHNILVNTSDAVAGATTLATLTANTVHNQMKRDFYIAQGNATTSVGSGVSVNIDDTSNTQTLSVINWAVDQYLIYTVTLNTLDSGYGLGYTIEQVL